MCTIDSCPRHINYTMLTLSSPPPLLPLLLPNTESLHRSYSLANCITHTVLLAVRYCCLQIVIRFISVYIFFSLVFIIATNLFLFLVSCIVCSTLFDDHYFFFCFALFSNSIQESFYKVAIDDFQLNKITKTLCLY